MALKPWAAEVAVDAGLASALIEEQFPQLAPAQVRTLGEGWDNAVFLVNGTWVFRFPRRAVAAPLIETELRVLPRIAPALPLPVPVPELRGSPGRRFPWTFAAHRLLPGCTADRAALTDAQRIEAAAPLGHFIRALHALSPDGLEGDRIRRLDAQRLRREIRGRLSRAPGFVDDPVREAREEVLVHGDLHARQLLVDGGRLCGVIDWGDAHRGDRAVDLAVAHSFLPAEGRERFRAAYGPIDEETWKLARLRAAHVSAALFSYARDIEDLPLAAEAEGALERIDEGDSTG